jgi:hypothetical protein
VGSAGQRCRGREQGSGGEKRRESESPTAHCPCEHARRENSVHFETSKVAMLCVIRVGIIRAGHDELCVKVTYIETQFVTSDAASFKSLVQRLTGKSAEATGPEHQLHRPRPCCLGAGGRNTIAGARSYSISNAIGSPCTATDDVQTVTPGAS